MPACKDGIRTVGTGRFIKSIISTFLTGRPSETAELVRTVTAHDAPYRLDSLYVSQLYVYDIKEAGTRLCPEPLFKRDAQLVAQVIFRSCCRQLDVYTVVCASTSARPLAPINVLGARSVYMNKDRCMSQTQHQARMPARLFRTAVIPSSSIPRMPSRTSSASTSPGGCRQGLRHCLEI